MAEPPNVDPFAPWRDLVAQWEKGVNAAANRTMATDEFSSSMHGGMALTLKTQEALRDAMAAYLAGLNVPSRSDVAALGERIGQLESRLARIETLLERVAAGPPGASAGDGAVPGDAETQRAPRPPRTKRPPSGEPPA